eukprot:2917295-Rhodomonas_salina.1
MPRDAPSLNSTDLGGVMESTTNIGAKDENNLGPATATKGGHVDRVGPSPACCSRGEASWARSTVRSVQMSIGNGQAKEMSLFPLPPPSRAGESHDARTCATILRVLSFVYLFTGMSFLLTESFRSDTSLFTGFRGESFLLWLPRMLEGLLLSNLVDSLATVSVGKSELSQRNESTAQQRVGTNRLLDWTRMIAQWCCLVITLSALSNLKLRTHTDHNSLMMAYTQSVCGTDGHIDPASFFDAYLFSACMSWLTFKAYQNSNQAMPSWLAICGISAFLIRFSSGVTLCSIDWTNGHSRASIFLLSCSFILSSSFCLGFSTTIIRVTHRPSSFNLHEHLRHQ